MPVGERRVSGDNEKWKGSTNRATYSHVIEHVIEIGELVDFLLEDGVAPLLQRGQIVRLFPSLPFPSTAVVVT